MSEQTIVDGSRRGWLFVIPWPLEMIGGVNEVVRNLVHQIADDGRYRPAVMSLEWAAKSITRKAGDASNETFAFRMHAPVSLRTIFGFLVSFIPTMRGIRKFLLERNIAVVNCHYPGPSAIVFALARRAGWFRRFIVSIHGADLQAATTSGLLHEFFWRRVVGHADVVVTCSHALARQLEEAVPRLVGRVVVVHNGVDESRIEADVPHAGDDADAREPVLLCVGTLERKKGIDVLMKAFASVSDAHPSFRLVCVGRSSPFAGELRALRAEIVARRPGLDARIDLIEGEAHRDVLRRMSRASVLVLASRIEPFGIVILEAGLLRTPVIATRVGGIPEIVSDGVDGLLVPADDVDALAAALSRLLADPSARVAFAERLHRRVVEDFSWASAGQRYLALANDSPVRG